MVASVLMSPKHVSNSGQIRNIKISFPRPENLWKDVVTVFCRKDSEF